MARLPKIVRYRLGQPSSSAVGTDHPDANLLAGFIERSLTPRERGLVLDHLAQCAGCREQVSLALPHPEGETAITSVAARRRWPVWLRWPVLRWGLLAVSLVTMGSLALVRQRVEHQTKLAARAVMPPSKPPLPSDMSVGAVPPKAARPSDEFQAAAPMKDQHALREFVLKPGAGSKKAEQSGSAVQFALRGDEAQTVPPPAIAQAPEGAFRASAASTALPRPNQPRELAVTPPANPAGAQLGSKAPPAAMPAAAPALAQSALQPSSAGTPAKVDSSQTAEAERGQAVGGPVVGGVPGAAAPQPAASGPRTGLVQGTAAASPVAPPVSVRASLAKSAPAPTSPSAGISATASIPAGADWSISATGKVQRSLDGRKTWEEVDVDKNVVFRVVFAVGPDVWLGGTKGALYHSIDGGQHWTRVALAAGSSTVAADIVHIDFKDSQHGAVQAAGHETWVTSDGGQHWQKQ